MIHIATATDAAYLPWAATAIRSAADANAEGSLVIHVLHDGGLSAADIALLERSTSDRGVTIVPHPVADRRVSRMAAIGRFGRTVWLRFLLPEVLPELGRVVFVDADTFFLHSVAALWDEPMDAPIGAVANVVEPAMWPHVRSLGIEDPRDFFNSGVLLMDLEKMRARGDTHALLTYAEERGDGLVWPDQDALNAVFASEWHRLHPRWNAMNSLWTWRPWAENVFGPSVVHEATTSPAILHFEGPAMCKPWHHLSTHPWRHSYRIALRRTPWCATPLEGRTLATRAISLLPERFWLPAYLKLRRGRV